MKKHLLVLMVTLLFSSAFCISTYEFHNYYDYEKVFGIKIPAIRSFILNIFLIFAFFTLALNNNIKKIHPDKIDLIFIGMLIFQFISYPVIVNKAIYFHTLSVHIGLYLLYIFYRKVFTIDLQYYSKLLYKLVLIWGIVLPISYIYQNFDLLTLIAEGNAYQFNIKKTSSFIGGKNITGWFVTLQMLLILILKPENSSKFIAGIMLTFTGFFLLLLGSRNAWAGLAAAFLVTIYALKPNRKLILYILLGFTISIGLFFILIDNETIINHLQSSMLKRRPIRWLSGIEMFLSKPLTGYGLGQLSIFGNIFKIHSHPHNDLLRIAIEGGLVNLSLYILMIGRFIFLSFKYHKIKKDTKHILIISFLIGYFVMSLFDELIYNINHQHLLVIVLALLNIKLLKIDPISKIKNVQIYSYFTVTLLFLLIYYVVSTSLLFCRLDNIKTNQSRKNIPETIQRLTNVNSNFIDIYRHRPINYQLAILNQMEDRIALSKIHIDKCLDDHPNDIAVLELKYEISKKMKDNIEIIKTADHIMKIEPWNVMINDDLLYISRIKIKTKKE